MDSIDLPEPIPHGETSVERAIATRASRRSFASDSITLEDASRLLWAAQGVTHVRDGVRLRAAPSAGASYPLIVFLIAEARDLNVCPVGAFSDAELAAVLSLPDALDPLYLLPVGNRPSDP